MIAVYMCVKYKMALQQESTFSFVFSALGVHLRAIIYSCNSEWCMGMANIAVSMQMCKLAAKLRLPCCS